VRRTTLITIICLFVLLGIAAVYQMMLASGDATYPGPNLQTPLPSIATTP
jgi:hypothetical protein